MHGRDGLRAKKREGRENQVRMFSCTKVQVYLVMKEIPFRCSLVKKGHNFFLNIIKKDFGSLAVEFF